jgi:hypothetical protein
MRLSGKYISIILLSIMGVGSAVVSLMGFMILGIGEACCHLNEPGGTAYACFAWTLTLTLIVFLIYLAWSPAKPIIFWIWAGIIVASLTAMNVRSPHSVSIELHPGQFIHGVISYPLIWAMASIVGLAHLEAHIGSRTWGKANVAQGA